MTPPLGLLEQTSQGDYPVTFFELRFASSQGLPGAESTVTIPAPPLTSWADCKQVIKPPRLNFLNRKMGMRAPTEHTSRGCCDSLSYFQKGPGSPRLTLDLGPPVFLGVNNMGQLTHCDGEGNGNPLQYSCLENPRDRGAWRAAVYGVAQSGTQLKRLSIHACIGEGNGNPLQYSCLENPRDRGAWWAAIYGVVQSRT